MKLHFPKTVWSDTIILEEDGHFALVDTGFSEQKEQIFSYLDRLGVKDIDWILLTHFHRDHYGNVESLIQNYPVKTVYFKEYSGHDSTTAWGAPADDAYRENEIRVWNTMRDNILKYSTLTMAEGLTGIPFSGHTLYLYATENRISEIYEDTANPETCHRITCGENDNSLSVFFEADGKTVFLGGDMMDHDSAHPLAAFCGRRVAKEINREIDVYKAPHHGTVHTATPEMLAIYRPKTAVITNGMEWLPNYDTFENLRAANPDVRILLTEKEDVVIDLREL